MAEHVAAALERRETLIVEAGTGTGKTFAYLVPALAVGAARDRLDRHARAAGPALSPRPARDLRRARPAGARRAAQGPRQLPVPAPSRPRRAAGVCARHAARGRHRNPEGARVVARDEARRHRRTARARRGRSRVAVGHLDARELPRQRVPGVRRVLRARGASRGAGRRHRGREPLPADGRPRAQGGRLRRPAAGRRRHRHRRGAPAAGRRRAVPRLQRQHATVVRDREGRVGRVAARAADGRRASTPRSPGSTRRWPP